VLFHGESNSELGRRTMTANRKIGQGAIQAAARKGARELAQATQAFPDSIGVYDEPGQLWSVTQQEASQQTGVSMAVHDSGQPQLEQSAVKQENSILSGLIEKAQQQAPEIEQEKQHEMG
ncbi:MAG: hypothetical protein AAFP90_20795, partial [Planctomycetota bacterium]